MPVVPRAVAVADKGLIPLAHLLEDVPPARLFEETCKLFMTGHGMRSMEALQRFGLSATLFPGLPKGAGPGKMQLGGVLRHSLENTDERVRTEKPVTPAFLYAALLWSEVEQRASHYASQGDPDLLVAQSDGGVKCHVRSSDPHQQLALGPVPVVLRGASGSPILESSVILDIVCFVFEYTKWLTYVIH